MPEPSEEGWYTDPYGRHEARWMSEGKPTKLVRDAGVESYDAPLQESATRVPEEIEIDPPVGRGPSDLLRADDAELEEFDPKAAIRAAWDIYDQSGGWGVLPAWPRPSRPH